MDDILPASLLDAPLTNSIGFIHKVKERLSQELHLYDSFLEILQAYQSVPKEQQSVSKVFGLVAQLFHCETHRDILQNFSQFLRIEQDNNIVDNFEVSPINKNVTKVNNVLYVRSMIFCGL